MASDPKRATARSKAEAQPPGHVVARRERILSTARELIARKGIEGVTVRDLAARCGVAVATLYNQFGSREAIVAAALEADFRGRFEPISERTSGWNPADQLRERIGESVRAILGPLRAYTKSVMFFYFHHTPDPRLRATIHDFIAQDFTALIREVGARGDLQPWVDADSFADDLVTQLYSLAMKWAQGHIRDRTLESRMLSAAAASFIGISRGRTRKAFEQLVAGSA